jgi:CheY-like chemotaxis protein
MNKNNVILHVEDDPNDVVLVELAFRKASFPSVLKVVNDGELAVGYLNGDGIYSNRETYPFPTLMLLDMKLPRRSGLEVLSWVRAHKDPQIRFLPVVILTSSNQPPDIVGAYDLGVNSYLVKPGDLGLLAEMAKAISQYWLGYNVKPATARFPQAEPRSPAATT